ncbi:MAG: serine/threonine-protein phosphatase [Clostridiales Family XIII bacterium]|jgi:hypothetical protein|nr:serine/threonine-protein phosphatase [Clostridiales Family XIII bacterium]
MTSLCTEVDWQSLNRDGEELCGDSVEILRPDDCTTVTVLSDGLGSGVKASILSTLTSKIISTMIARNIPIEECVSAIVATLPVCSVRQIAYSTFTILRVTGNGRAEVIQFDNPRVIFLRDGKHIEFPVSTRTIEGKTIHISDITLQEGDTFIAFSDGVEHAGVGHLLNFGWQRSDIVRFMEGLYKREYTAHTLTGALLDQCDLLYEGHPGDDATVCTVKVRSRAPVSLLIGPPCDPDDVDKMMNLFFAKAGKHIVCGGTTAILAAEYLGKTVNANLPKERDDPSIPPMAYIEGVDLVTEGVITISKVLEYSYQYLRGKYNYYALSHKTDGASRIALMLFEEATDIGFYVGKAINASHQNPHLPINFSIKMRLVQELTENLRSMGKHVKTSYF